jgi:nitrite reductase (NADH) small subunit
MRSSDERCGDEFHGDEHCGDELRGHKITVVTAKLVTSKASSLRSSSPARRRMTAITAAERWVPVCRLEDIIPNTGVCALVGGEQVAVFRLDDDSLYAISNHDPFSRANVLSRGIVGDLKGEVVVASPVYKQHFSLTTGACLEDSTVRVATFPVRVDGDTVWVKSH